MYSPRQVVIPTAERAPAGAVCAVILVTYYVLVEGSSTLVRAPDQRAHLRGALIGLYRSGLRESR